MFYVVMFDFAFVGLLLCAIAFLGWCWSWIPFGDRKPRRIYLQPGSSAQSKAQIKERTKRYA